MFQVGERVIYGSHGVCQIVSMEERIIDRKRIHYLVLESLAQPGSRYMVPSENPVALLKLRRLMTREELQTLLKSEVIRHDHWIVDENTRKQRYKELINSGGREALLGMIYTLHHQKKQQLELGRKFHQCDEAFLNDAQKLLTEEVSLVMGIDPSCVGAYILESMEE